jgi:hypothetical protein
MRGWRDSRYLAVALAILAILSVVVLFVFLRTVGKLSAGKVSVSSVKSRDGDVMSYIVVAAIALFLVWWMLRLYVL